MFAYLGYTTVIKNFFLNISSNPYIIVLLIYAFLFVAGMFVQTAPIIVIISPLLLPVAEAVGIDPVHFGIIITLALARGLRHPARGLQPVCGRLHVGHEHRQDFQGSHTIYRRPGAGGDHRGLRPPDQHAARQPVWIGRRKNRPGEGPARAFSRYSGQRPCERGPERSVSA